MVDEDASTDATTRLRHLAKYFREHPVTGPVEGHASTVNAAAPLSLTTLSHIDASVREVVAFTRRANPQAEPAPSRADAVYDWCRRNTQHSEETVQLQRDIVEFRQGLEHAVRAGDTKVVRPIRCPKCSTWGLFWVSERQAAVCTNTDCVDRDGCSNAFTLAHLAHHAVTSRKNLRQACAT